MKGAFGLAAVQVEPVVSTGATDLIWSTNAFRLLLPDGSEAGVGSMLPSNGSSWIEPSAMKVVLMPDKASKETDRTRAEAAADFGSATTGFTR